MDCVI